MDPRLTRLSLPDMKQPTNPDSANESSASSQLDSTLMPPQMSTNNSLLSANGTLTPGASGLSATASGPSSMMGGMGYGDAGYDFFDPQHWMLDGLLDFNYSFVPPLDGT